MDSLFAVCVTLGTIPILRCPKGNAAEAVAVRLDKKLRENLRDARNSLFVNDGIQVKEKKGNEDPQTHQNIPNNSMNEFISRPVSTVSIAPSW